MIDFRTPGARVRGIAVTDRAFRAGISGYTWTHLVLCGVAESYTMEGLTDYLELRVVELERAAFEDLNG